jgi:hypothetical protein
MNNPTRIITIVIGVILALSGIHHGFFEILQGNTPTNKLVIQAIGKNYQSWDNGDEAFTIIPNFLFTGIAAVGVGIFIIIWSIAFVHKKYGRVVFLLLFVLLTFVGGGIGHILFYLLTWAYATRMNKQLHWWKKIMPHGLQNILSKIWIVALVVASICFILGLEISVFGIPGMTNSDTILAICWSFLLAALIFVNITYISGFAARIKNQNYLVRIAQNSKSL